MTVSQELWDQVESARGVVPRAKWVKLALEAFLAPKRLDPRVDKVATALEARDAVRDRNQQVQAARPQVARPQFVRARTLVSPEIQSEWAEIMAARQERLNKRLDTKGGAA